MRPFWQVYVFRESLVLIAMHPYSTADIGDVYSHLTNTCVSLGHDDFKVGDVVPCSHCAVYLANCFATTWNKSAVVAAASVAWLLSSMSHG